ncbi:MAG: hypothetical protein WDN27_05680 [Candidatus Saccharibacteria bacterium]
MHIRNRLHDFVDYHSKWALLRKLGVGLIVTGIAAIIRGTIGSVASKKHLMQALRTADPARDVTKSIVSIEPVFERIDEH